ncbi:hypothetical protein BM613_14600 [Sulfoacidibacillus thermotolerans]|uniref:Uncharacterized protein n=1 Tax=Sulfoacidibacillus thermotolerans TaxID=1765684 RepID=A0A2U3CLE2_SULT2|nr:hypothetical protein BM613_14600 [Sulfoacidibacillus thermotolerans]
MFVFLAGLLSVAMFLTGCGLKSKNNIEDTSKNVLINYNAYKKSTPTFSQITYFKIITSSPWFMNRNGIWHATTIQGTWHKVFHLQHPIINSIALF